MKTTWFFGLFMCFVAFRLAAKETPVYTTNEIPAQLKANANAVIRQSETNLRIISAGSITYSQHTVISILNSEGEHLAIVQVGIEKGKELKSFRASLFDASGKLIKKFSKKDKEDYSANGFSHQIDDYRVEVWRLDKTAPPYTIEYEYEWTSANSFQLPYWQPVSSEKISLEQAVFNVYHTPEQKVNFVADNLTEKPLVSSENISWKLDNFKAFATEFFSGSFEHVLPVVHLGLQEFELYGAKGSAKTWSDLAQFVANLHTGRDVIQKIDDPQLSTIYQAQEPPLQKAKKLYAYLQNHLRYVAIELGIAGWQPQDANFTLQKKYGDCKALATLMKALLKQAGIESNCVLVFAGNDREMTKENFIASQFNHEILCIPMDKDTFWLDCTSPYNPFNYLGSFTEGRPCLILGKSGGMLSHTPVYNEKVNISRTRFDISLNENNTSSITGHVDCEGELQDNLRVAFALKDNKRVEGQIRTVLGLPNTEITRYQAGEISPEKPSVKFNLELSNYSSVKQTANRLFINTDLVKPIKAVPEPIEENHFQLNIVTGFDMSDSLVFHLPAGYKPENFTPGDEKEIETQFGKVKIETALDKKQNTLLVKRSFVLKKAKYPAAKFADFRKFMLQATEAYMPKLVMKKTE